MKFIIKQILIALTLILIINESQGQRDVRKYRMSNVLQNIIKKINIHHEIESELDIDCTKSYLNLPQNNKMIVNEGEELIIFIGAAIKCANAEEELFDSIFEKFVHDSWKNELPCFKYHLYQLEPTSKLIENFVINEADHTKCNSEFRLFKEIKDFPKEIENFVGPVDILTCGTIIDSAKEFLKFLSKGIVIKYDDISDELKKTEKEKLKELFKNLTLKTIDCIIKRYETDPKAYQINDTLSYHYKNSLVPYQSESSQKPLESEEDDSNNYYKRLAKVEETFDYDCVKKNLNLEENGEKALLEVEALVLIASAKSKCIKIDPLEFADVFMNFAVDRGQQFIRPYSCAKYKLQKLEPTSKLAITTSINEPHEKYCRHYDVNVHPFRTWAYVDQVGRLNETTCGVLTNDIVDVIALKTVLLFNEKDKELKINETNELYATVTDKLHKLADCILERIE